VLRAVNRIPNEPCKNCNHRRGNGGNAGQSKPSAIPLSRVRLAAFSRVALDGGRAEVHGSLEIGAVERFVAEGGCAAGNAAGDGGFGAKLVFLVFLPLGYATYFRFMNAVDLIFTVSLLFYYPLHYFY